MDIAALKTFLAITEEGSFSRAAERLFITQPAVSKRITSLESELNARLFDREGRRIRLTEAGQLLLPNAQEIVNQADRTRELLTSLSGAVTGSLRMASSHHIGLHRLPNILKHFSRQHPKVELDLRFLDSENACRQVESGELEFALITLPGRLPEMLQEDVIWQDPLAIVTAHDALPQNTTLLETRAILPPRNTWTRQIIDHCFDRAGIKIRTLIETNNLETIRRMVEIGLGWSVLPTTMLSPSLRSVRIQGLTLQRQLGLVRHRRRSNSNAANAMISLLKEGIAKAHPGLSSQIQQLNRC